MLINPIKPNLTEVTVNGLILLYSYRTLVLAWEVGHDPIRTSTFHSVTTSRHINQWLDGREAKLMEQEALEAYAKGARVEMEAKALGWQIIKQ